MARGVGSPVLVLGSAQPAAHFDLDRAAAAGIEVARRRSGGGAVLVGPGDPVWIDLWVPRGDPLWHDDVLRAAEWAGEWWARWLRRAGAEDVAVHRGRSAVGAWSDRICFAGVGPGEVTAGARKVVGVAQWRCREGALFHTCAYRHWDPGPVADLLSAPDGERRAAAARLAGTVAGLDELRRVGGLQGLQRAGGPAGPGTTAGARPKDPDPGLDGLLGTLPGGPAWRITHRP